MANKFDDYMLNSIDKSYKNSGASIDWLKDSAAAKVKNQNSGASIDWLKGNVKDLLSGANALKSSNDARIAGLGQSTLTKSLNKNSIGRMYMYVYDPKHKDTLPYYDTMPLIFVVAFTADGFYGLNLHYVPPSVRAQIIEALTKNLNRTNITESRKVKMSYDILRKSSKFEIIKHCFKRYLFSHVKSSMLFIDPAEWDKTILLPTERFKKANKAAVYKNSLRG